MGQNSDSSELVVPHGGYRNLKSFRIAQLVYDITVRFCELYVSRFSRTRDQMVQAARSGVQNIAEGSLASGTSKKTELKLTNVARASLEELCLDYEDFLRHRGMEVMSADHPALVRFKGMKCSSLDEVREWVLLERKGEGSRLPSSALVANAALSLINLARHLLGRQISAQAEAFLKNGGFTERLYRSRRGRRQS